MKEDIAPRGPESVPKKKGTLTFNSHKFLISCGTSERWSFYTAQIAFSISILGVICSHYLQTISY